MRKDQGPPSYENWMAAEQGQESARAEEYPLFTDAHITGEITEGYGPYQFLNAIAHPEHPADIQPAIILRAEKHLTHVSQSLRPMDTTDGGYYHGGNQIDEIAALVSLALGIRCKAGGMTRCFDGPDPRGRPRAGVPGRNPAFLRRTTHATVLPRARGTHSLDNLEPLQLLIKMSPLAVTALIRAARLYQDGLWIAESDPSTSWLLLVSAIETAAECWRDAEDTPVERLSASRPDLYELLKNTGVAGLPEQVAPEIISSLGATKKFIDFIMKYLPTAPAVRPPKHAQVPWSNNNMKKALWKIYDYRSRALHGGIPFPLPMCEAPFKHVEWGAPAEKPTGLATRSGGCTWLAKDTPILLHTFEYIAHGALLKWWRSLEEQGDSGK